MSKYSVAKEHLSDETLNKAMTIAAEVFWYNRLSPSPDALKNTCDGVKAEVKRLAGALRSDSASLAPEQLHRTIFETLTQQKDHSEFKGLYDELNKNKITFNTLKCLLSTDGNTLKEKVNKCSIANSQDPKLMMRARALAKESAIKECTVQQELANYLDDNLSLDAYTKRLKEIDKLKDEAWDDIIFQTLNSKDKHPWVPRLRLELSVSGDIDFNKLTRLVTPAEPEPALAIKPVLTEGADLDDSSPLLPGIQILNGRSNSHNQVGIATVILAEYKKNNSRGFFGLWSGNDKEDSAWIDWLTCIKEGGDPRNLRKPGKNPGKKLEELIKLFDFDSSVSVAPRMP